MILKYIYFKFDESYIKLISGFASKNFFCAVLKFGLNCKNTWY